MAARRNPDFIIVARSDAFWAEVRRRIAKPVMVVNTSEELTGASIVLYYAFSIATQFAALKRPDVLEKLQSYGYAAEGSTPERLLEINRADLALWRELVAKAGIPLE